MIPIRDSTRSHTTPWVTVAIVAVNLAVFIYMLTLSDQQPLSQRQRVAEFTRQTNGECYGYQGPPTEIERFYCRWSFQPREFFDAIEGKTDVPNPQPTWQVYLTLVTSVFLHAGWLHILGNLLFLWIFGDNVEDRFGHFRFLLFYLLAGAIATFVQASVDPTSVTPTVGASGAIGGVLGAYLVIYPRATVYVVIPFFALIFVPLPVPAVVMIGVWFLQNLLAGFATLGATAGPDAGVAFFAHVGGFLFGMAVALLSAGGRPRKAPRWERG